MKSDELHDDWNPVDVSTLADQRGAYDEMRERCPVAHSKFLGWSLFRHEDIAAVLADPATYSNVSQFLAIPNGMDPPVHGRCRDMLAPNFDQQQLATLEPQFRAIAEALLAPVLAGAETEFIDTFAIPYGLKTLCVWLGWPEQHWENLALWVQESQRAAFNKDPVKGKAQADFFADLVMANLDMHRVVPSETVDATDALLNTEMDGVRLNDEQIVGVLRNWAAGHGTVIDGLGLVVLHLAQNINLQNLLRKDLSLIPAAIEEILRADGPLVANPRTTTREVNIQGKTIAKGERLTLMWIAANRDPRTFADPTEVKIERNTEASLVWGQGIHVCQGAALARIEMRVALEILLAATTHFVLTEEGASHRAVYPGNGLTDLFLRLS